MGFRNKLSSVHITLVYPKRKGTHAPKLATHGPVFSLDVPGIRNHLNQSGFWRPRGSLRLLVLSHWEPVRAHPQGGATFSALPWWLPSLSMSFLPQESHCYIHIGSRMLPQALLGDVPEFSLLFGDSSHQSTLYRPVRYRLRNFHIAFCQLGLV